MIALTDKRALVVGVADEQSIAWGVVEALHHAGAMLAVTYRDEEVEPRVRSLAERVDAHIIMPLDVTREEDEDQLFARIVDVWGSLDILVLSIGFAPDSNSRVGVSNGNLYGLPQAMAVRSLIRLARRAEPLMTRGGACLAMNFSGAEQVATNCNLVRLLKAALEATTRELASELGPRNIRVNALVPRPAATHAVAGTSEFGAPRRKVKCSPLRRPLTTQDVGAAAAFLFSDGARNISGYVLHVDAGWHIVD
ncbi:MAG TPA: SDR family oxidoreductase [Roseiarcus sp.]